MNRKNKWIIFLSVVLTVVIALLVYMLGRNGEGQKLKEVKPFYGNIKSTISTVGTVKPQNRLEIKPPINGRIEKIIVDEGQEVKEGEVLALMSSTERATLMDAARLKGDREYKYWQKAYRETPLMAPIDGVVIVRDVEPGQTVTTGDAVLVLSNRLIVEADVDETDIGAMKVGQNAVIGLDAYPHIKIDAIVDHISYESEVVNNVTIYKVDILPTEIPDVFRSGMSANVEVIVKEADNVLLIPSRALIHEKGKVFVLIKDMSKDVMKKVLVETGLEKDGMTEIVSGISEKDIILTPEDTYVVPKENNGTNPFLPSFKGKKNGSKK